MSTVSNVTAAKPATGGALRRAVYGTALPADATTALNEAFKTLGYLSEDGYTNSNAPEVTDTKAWNGDVVLSDQTGKSDTFTFKLIEALNDEVLKAVYGDSNVSGSLSAGLTVKANSDDQESASWVIEEVLKDGVVARTVIANGKITAVSDITHKAGEPVAYEVTITAYPDSSIDNCTHITYYKES